MLAGAVFQNQGALGSAREGAFPVVFLHGHLRRHPREHSPEHPDFGEHTPGGILGSYILGFSLSGQSLRPGSSLH